MNVTWRHLSDNRCKNMFYIMCFWSLSYTRPPNFALRAKFGGRVYDDGYWLDQFAWKFLPYITLAYLRYGIRLISVSE